VASSALREIEERIPLLSTDERRDLLDRLAQSLRPSARMNWTSELAAMARDPEIQREVREIEAEFAPALEDGLERP